MLRVRLTKKATRALIVVVCAIALSLFVLSLPWWLARASFQQINTFNDNGYIITNVKVQTCSIFNLQGCLMGNDWFLVDKPVNYNSRGKQLYHGLWSQRLYVEKKPLEQVTQNDEVIVNLDNTDMALMFKYEKFDPNTPERYYYNLDLLFGADAVDPRPDWEITEHPLNIFTTDILTFLTLRRKPNLSSLPKIDLQIAKSQSQYTILQVADLHFSTDEGLCRDQYPEVPNCKADKRSLKFLNKVLDLEKPDLIVLTGDQIFGEDSFDSVTTMLKVLKPFIDRKIPYALMFGNHDDEGSMDREELMSLLQTLPYNLAASGPDAVEGVGNYHFQVNDAENKESVMTFFVLDTHKYSPNPKVLPGYDWIKETQLEYLTTLDKDLAYGAKDLKFAFFHIPLPEYRNLQQPFTGNYKEAITAPKYNTFARDLLQKIGVNVVSVGHDHCNDYCILDSKDEGENNKIWLCYGGAAGEGGYGGYGGTTRRLRTFKVELDTRSVKSYKRLETSPEDVFDEQYLVRDGVTVVQ